MISLRYHIVSIAAVFLALAVGVVLGSTALSDALLSGVSDKKDELAGKLSDTQDQNTALRAKLERADSFAAGVGPSAVRGKLAKRTVAIVSTADASDAAAKRVAGLVKDAGGKVTSRTQLTKAFSDPNRADQLGDVVTRVLPSGAHLPSATDPGTLAGGLFGSLLLLDKHNKAQAEQGESTAALSALREGGFVKGKGDATPAQLAIVVTGGAARGDDSGGRASTVARFAGQLGKSGAGTVLAGADGSAEGNGPVGVVRADSGSSRISTVDDVHRAQGRVATVLALHEQLRGKSGHYGTAGSAKTVIPGTGRR